MPNSRKPLNQQLTESISESDRMHSEILEAIRGPDSTRDLTLAPLRTKISSAYCKLTIEHGRGITRLMAERLPLPAAALLRSQHDALLRATWVYGCASDNWLNTFGDWQYTTESSYPRFPGTDVLLKRIEREDALANLHRFLINTGTASRGNYHSFTHGGILAVFEIMQGFDQSNASQLLRSTAAHSYNAAVLACEISQDQDALRRITEIRRWPN